MRKYLLLLCIPLFILGCKKEQTPGTEVITKGSKWNLKIGSNHAEVYSQMQILGAEKDFSNMALITPEAKLVAQDLNKPYDAELQNYSTWTFSFSVAVKDPNKSGRTSVRLYFSNGKLGQIESTYSEDPIIYN